jgi:hypothetical protein
LGLGGGKEKIWELGFRIWDLREEEKEFGIWDCGEEKKEFGNWDFGFGI